MAEITVLYPYLFPIAVDAIKFLGNGKGMEDYKRFCRGQPRNLQGSYNDRMDVFSIIRFVASHYPTYVVVPSFYESFAQVIPEFLAQNIDVLISSDILAACLMNYPQLFTYVDLGNLVLLRPSS